MIQATQPTGGLSLAEVEARRASGEDNRVRLGTSRPYGEILQTNLLNPINILVFSIGTVHIAIGRLGDAAASVGLILFNVAVGIVQEVRAKRQLDRIAFLARPKVSVLREGQESRVDPSELVKGDLVIARPGDQFVVDGILVSDDEVQVDESLLTGESDHVAKRKGDPVLSASFCVVGQGFYEAIKVGEESYANRLTRQARRFQVSLTPLQHEIDLTLRLLLLLATFIGGVSLIGTIVSAVPLIRQVQMASIIAGLIPNSCASRGVPGDGPACSRPGSFLLLPEMERARLLRLPSRCICSRRTRNAWRSPCAEARGGPSGA